jgi:aldose 1-epimerase
MNCLQAAAGLLAGIAISGTLSGAVTEADFGKTREGSVVKVFTITAQSGLEARIMTQGATLLSLKVPDRSGKTADVVLGFDTLDAYLRPIPFFGATVGRYGNRIGGAKFTLENKQYAITPNDRGNALHGGRRGFDKVEWSGARIDDQTVEFTYISKDGEEGFPGTLTARVRYALSDAGELKLDYSATTDKPTVVNLTNHSYFNLAGQGNGTILDEQLMIDAEQYTPTDAASIPTGEIADVAGTPFDFREPHKIGERIESQNEQLRFGNGYDHNFVLTRKEGLRRAATLYEPVSGRFMEILTTEPGLQFYSGNGLNGQAGKGGVHYPRHAALCLETQHFPDSPNKPQFPTTELKPGDTYRSTTIYRFSVRPAQ